MLLLSICGRCAHGKVSRPSYSKDGDMIVSPSVRCEKADGVLLFVGSAPPEGCPYTLEHVMAGQDADPEFVEWMSGRRLAENGND